MPVEVSTPGIEITKVEQIDATNVFYPNIQLTTPIGTAITNGVITDQPYAIVNNVPVFAKTPNQIRFTNFSTAAANLVAEGRQDFEDAYVAILAGSKAASESYRERQATLKVKKTALDAAVSALEQAT